VKPDRIHVIYKGINVIEYQRTSETKALTDYGVDAAKPYVLFVSRITRQKGVTHLVDAIRYLPWETQVVLCAGAPDSGEIATELRQNVRLGSVINQTDVLWVGTVTVLARLVVFGHKGEKKD
jgi:starch synthase